MLKFDTEERETMLCRAIMGACVICGRAATEGRTCPDEACIEAWRQTDIRFAEWLANNVDGTTIGNGGVS